MASIGKAKSALALVGRVINEAVSFIVFSVLDLVDFLLCFLYRVADFFIEAEWKPCYCSSSKEAITSSGKILVSEQGESKIVCLSSTKLQLEEISDTLYTRPSLLSEVSKLTMKETKKGTVRSTFTVNSTIVEMLQGKIGGQQCHPIPRWSDCDCKFCTSWTSNSKETLYVRTEGPKGKIIFSFSQNIYDKIYYMTYFFMPFQIIRHKKMCFSYMGLFHHQHSGLKHCSPTFQVLQNQVLGFLLLICWGLGGAQSQLTPCTPSESIWR